MTYPHTSIDPPLGRSSSLASELRPSGGGNAPSLVKIGERLAFGGQIYHCTGLEPHQRRDGTLTHLAVFAASCSECGAGFEFRSPAQSGWFAPNRRCEAHRRPGRRVAKAEKQDGTDARGRITLSAAREAAWSPGARKAGWDRIAGEQK